METRRLTMRMWMRNGIVNQHQRAVLRTIIHIKILFLTSITHPSFWSQKHKEYVWELWVKTAYARTREFLQHVLFLRNLILSLWLRNSIVKMAQWRRDWSSSTSRVTNFYFSMLYRLALGLTQPPIRWVPAALSPRHEADQSPPTSARSRKHVSVYISTPPYVFMT
jgi:hypothetical protein